jgi:hypothetical protein
MGVSMILRVLSAGVVTAGVSMAMLAGAGLAFADDGTASGTGKGSSSESSNSPGKRQNSDNEASKPAGKKGEVAGNTQATDAGDKDSAGTSKTSATDQGATGQTSEAPAPKGTVKKRSDHYAAGPAAHETTGRGNKSAVAADDSPVGDTKGGAKGATKPADHEVTADGRVHQSTKAIESTADDPRAVAVSTEKTSAEAATAAVTVAGTSTHVAMDAAAAPILSNVINAIGNLVFNVLALVTNLAAGPPVLPPRSTVTVARSTLQVGDTTVPADWYFPSGPAPPTGLIYLQHGAFAVASMYSYTAANLAEQTNSIVVAPTLSTNGFAPDGMWLGGTPLQTAVADLFLGDRAALTASASAAAGHTVTLPEHFVLAGHSLGGVFVAAVAGDLADDGATHDLAGVVLFDPTPSSGQDAVMPVALAKLPADLPVLLIGSPPSYWNELGSAANALVAARPGQFVGVILDGGSHADSLQGGNPLIQLIEDVVSGVPRPQNIAATETLASGWITDMFAGTRDGIYAAPGEVFPIDTPAGTATAYALPDIHHQASPLQVLLTALVDFLTAGLGNQGSAGSAAVAPLQTRI